MNKQNFITMTFIITGLVFSPAMGDTVEERRVSQSQSINQSIVKSIAYILYNRGLEEDAANEIAENFLDEEDGMFLAMMMQHLENQGIVTKEEVLTYISQLALRKQKLDVKSYDQLIGMVANIKQKPVDENTRIQLSRIVKLNKLLFV